jgi:hypothetical protein
MLQRSLSSQLLLMGLYEFEHTIELEVNVRHLAWIHDRTEALLCVPPVNPARLQPVIVCRLVVVEHALSHVKDLFLLNADPLQFLDHVVEIAGWLRRKCAMLGLLDRATKLTSSQGEKREYLDPRLKPQALPAGRFCRRADPCCAPGERYFRGGARSTPRKSNGAAPAFFQL